MIYDIYDSDNGRAYAFQLTGDEQGKAFQLPHLGRARFENVVVNPHVSGILLLS